MRNICTHVGLLLSFLFIASVGEADELEQRLQAHFAPAEHVTFVQYERVDHAPDQTFSAMRYFVLDFTLSSRDERVVQREVHSICSRVLNDEPLVRRLSQEGIDMVSVSFDRHTQFDCL